MHVEFAVFDGEVLLSRGRFHCIASSRTECFAGAESHQFTITHRFDLPACRVFIECRQGDTIRYRAGLAMGVHDSDDWEAVDLGQIHTFAFRCSVDVSE